MATFAADTIDMYVQVIDELDPADPQLDEKIGSHPLMIQEVCKQKEDLLRLTTIKSQTDLHEFRSHSSNPEKSNIGLVHPEPVS